MASRSWPRSRSAALVRPGRQWLARRWLAHWSSAGPGSCGQPAVVSTDPSSRTRRAGRPASRSQGRAAALRMIAAVLAVLAATQLAAPTLTVLQQDLAGSPVAGVILWRIRRPPAAPARTLVLQAAVPPEPLLPHTS